MARYKYEAALGTASAPHVDVGVLELSEHPIGLGMMHDNVEPKERSSYHAEKGRSNVVTKDEES